MIRKYILISMPVTLYATIYEYNLMNYNRLYRYKYVNFLHCLPVGIFLGLSWPLYLPYAILEKVDEYIE